MKLIYCTVEGYQLALRYGAEVLDHEPGQDSPRWVRNAGRDVRRIETGEVEFQALDGVVAEAEDDDCEVTYFMLRDKTGREREFSWDGGGVDFPVGRGVIVRYVSVAPEVSSIPNGISVMEMWVD
jgi:hypothetical protein